MHFYFNFPFTNDKLSYDKYSLKCTSICFYTNRKLSPTGCADAAGRFHETEELGGNVIFHGKGVK